MLEKLMASPIAWTILAFFTILSVAFSVYTWVVGKKRKRISYCFETSMLIKNGSSQIKNLSIQFNNQVIEDLSVSHFYIWNSGNDVINEADVVEMKPLSIINTGTANILEATVLFTNETSNNIRIDKFANNSVCFAFDYLGAGDGAHVQVLHSGTANDLKVDGKLKGGESICNANENDKNNRMKTRLQQLFSNGIMFVLAYAICFGIAAIVANAVKGSVSDEVKLLIHFGVILIAGFVGVIIGALLSKGIKKYYGLLVPKTLKSQKNIIKNHK